MRPITPETPRKDIQIAGFVLKAPTPFKAGDVLEENEAAALNQTYLENVGNNFRSKATNFKRTILTGVAEPTPEQLKAVTDEAIKAFDEELANGTKTLTDEQKAALQADLDSVVAEYKMGTRRSSSVEVVDPVTKQARALAKDRLKKALVKKGIKLNTVSADWYTREIDKLLNKDEDGKPTHKLGAELWKTAERAVKLLQQAATEELDDIDTTDVTKSDDGDEAGGEGQGGETGGQAAE
jgi:uncharacterized protein (DUF927 family)